MKTIAWYRFLAGDASPADMTRWQPFDDVDQATIYRYRNGQISPKKKLLNADDEASQTARNVYEFGPHGVPLWTALWGGLTHVDLKLAEQTMPSGDWPLSRLNELFFDDQILARVMRFRFQVVHDESFTSDLETFAAAARVIRACRQLGYGGTMALRVLLEGTMALPGARGLLERYGLLKPMQEWISAQFDEDVLAQVEPGYCEAWRADDNVFVELCSLADQRRLKMRRSFLGGKNHDFDQ